MANTTFVNLNTIIVADWLNDVNNCVYNILGNGTTVPASVSALKTNLSLQNVDNTSDANKPLSSAATTALASKLDKTGTTGSAVLPTGTTAQRDGTPSVGYIRYNTTLSAFEGYSASGWGNLGSGSSGPITSSGLTQSTNRLLGRSTAGTGAIEELSTGSALEITSGTINVKSGSVTPAMLSQPVVALTPVATTSGTSVPFTGFPSTVNVIELDFNQVSESAGNVIRIQLGTSGGLVTSGYIGSNAAMTGSGYGGSALASGIDFRTSAIGAGARISGHLKLTHMGSNLWAFSGLCHDTAYLISYTVGGTLQLGAALTQLSVLANGGSFDGPAGSSVGGRYY